jgi:hypothetical protein
VIVGPRRAAVQWDVNRSDALAEFRIMEIQILVEPAAGNGYRAESSFPALSAEGPTADAATENLRQMLTSRLVAATRLVTVQLGPAPHPLAAQGGMYKDEPLYEAWRQAIEDYRNERENDPDHP